MKLVFLIEPFGYVIEEIKFLNFCKELFEFNNFKEGFIDSQSKFYKDKNADFNGSNLCLSLISKDRAIITEINITTLVNVLPYEKKIHICLLKVIGALPSIE